MDHGYRHNMAAMTSVTSVINETQASDTIGEGDTGDQAREDGETGD